MLTVPHVTNPWLPKPVGFSGSGLSEASNIDRELAAATANIHGNSCESMIDDRTTQLGPFYFVTGGY